MNLRSRNDPTPALLTQEGARYPRDSCEELSPGTLPVKSDMGLYLVLSDELVKNPPCNAGDRGSNPGWRTKIPHARHQLSPCSVKSACTLSRVRLSVTPTDCSPPGSTVYMIHPSRILEWIAIPFSRGSPQARDRTGDSCVASRSFIIWATGKTYSSLTVNGIICPWKKEAFLTFILEAGYLLYVNCPHSTHSSSRIKYHP